MAFKTTEIGRIPAVAFRRLVELATQTKREATLYRAQAAAGSVRAADLQVGMVGVLVDVRIEVLRVQSVRGLRAYARQQLDDPAYNMNAEVAALLNAIDTMTAWFEANFPQDAARHLLVWTFVGDGSGAMASAVLTDAAFLSALVTQLDLLLSAID